VAFVRSLWTAERYPNLELIVVHDTVTPPDALQEIDDITGGEAVLVPFHGPFHFSRKCNAGALAATGEYLCFLNDDMEVVTSDWLHEMASLLADPGVGAVGARLLFADGTLQHVGHEYNGGHAGHLMFRYGADDLDHGGAAHLTSERSGVTGACMLLRAKDFLQVGGFSEQFPLSYNDVDLSLKIVTAGFRILYTPHATLFHYESQTREPTVTENEMTQIRWRWAEQLHHDPYVNELRQIPLIKARDF
jgi:GT2 family glycosyltransferase